MSKAVVEFGDVLIEGVSLPARPRKNDMIHINYDLDVEAVVDGMDGTLVVGCREAAAGQDDQVPIVEVCIWVLNDDFPWVTYWQAGCKDRGVDGIIADDDDVGPLQWVWRYCPFCGLPIVQKMIKDTKNDPTE